MDGFGRFVSECEKDLRRIASHTKGEHTYYDVTNEAWLMAHTLFARQGVRTDFDDALFRNLLLSHLYQHLVRYSELNVRRAIRLDHGSGEDAERGKSHPLLNSLASDSGNDPLSFLLAEEGKPAAPTQANQQHSLASTYLTLLEHLGGRMHRVARYLLISRSYAYRCFAKARAITAGQHALLLAPPASASMLRPWRRERAIRIPRQLEFDFEEGLVPGLPADDPNALPTRPLHRLLAKTQRR